MTPKNDAAEVVPGEAGQPDNAVKGKRVDRILPWAGLAAREMAEDAAKAVAAMHAAHSARGRLDVEPEL